MDKHLHHNDLIKSVTEEYSEILTNSSQAIYIYLDDNNKVCNEKFSSLLGYKSEDEWAKIDKSFPETFVAEESQVTLVTAYQNAMEDMAASTNTIVWKKKDGSTVSTEVFLTPIVHEGHLFALHFVSNN